MTVRLAVLTALITMTAATWTMAQEDSIDETEQPTAVVVMQKPPATKLESFEQGIGVMITKGLTRVGNLASDDRAETNIYAIAMSDAGGRKQYGVMVELVIRDFRPVRCYVDEDELPQLVEGLAALSRVDKNSLPADGIEAVYRTRGNLEIFNRDQNGGRIAVIRGTVVSPISGQVRIARASFRTARLAEVVQQLNAAKDVISRLKNPK